MSALDKLDRRYVASGSWVCPQSPSGAHDMRDSAPRLIECRYCHQVKPAPLYWDEVVDFNNRQIPIIIHGGSV